MSSEERWTVCAKGHVLKGTGNCRFCGEPAENLVRATEVERLREALEVIVEGYHRGHILGPDLILQARAALHPDEES